VNFDHWFLTVYIPLEIGTIISDYENYSKGGGATGAGAPRGSTVLRAHEVAKIVLYPMCETYSVSQKKPDRYN